MRAASAAVLAAALLLIGAASASAAPPAPLAQAPEDGQPGEAAGRFKVAKGIAAEAGLPGHVFVLDQANARIEEFTAWGEFVKAWGWKVDKTAPEEKLQTCTALSECQAGSKGGGAGQMSVAEGIAVDGAGNVYVAELGNRRVQKFDPGAEGEEAKFLLTFGFKVNKTHEAGTEAEANLCTAASGDECQAGAVGAGPGKIGGGDYRNALAASTADGAVFVVEEKTIQRFSLGGAFAGSGEIIALPTFVEGLAVDSAGNLYVGQEDRAKKLKAQGGSAAFLTPEFPQEHPGEEVPGAVALDGHGNLYVVERAFGAEPAKVQKYDSTGACLTCGTSGEGGKPGFDRTTESNLEAIAATSACEADDAYVLHSRPSPEEDFFRAFGEHPDAELCEPPRKPPTIDDQFASTVQSAEAILKAQVNPHFWSGSLGTTTYRVQYATQACFEGGEWAAPCVKQTPEAVLPGGAVGEDVAVGVRLEGLTPGTAYRFRFAAEDRDSEGDPVVPGQPVFGMGGTPGIPGADATFTTFRTPGVEPCPPNEAFRGGLASLLPDCRAYEMVSPVDKEGGDIAVRPEVQTALPAVLSTSATSGNRLAYGSARSFGGAQSGPWTTQYIAARRPGQAWVTHPISPPRGRDVFEAAVLGFDTEFRLFSADLCGAWLQSYAELPGASPSAPAGVVDLFHRSDEECGGLAYTPINTVVPPVASGEQFRVELQGVSADEATAVFQANDELASGGHPAVIEKGDNVGPKQLYGEQAGEERFLCVLPGGTAWSGPCTAGGGGKAAGEGTSREANVTGALSSDGAKVYWSDNRGDPGKIYLRENPFGDFGPGAEECAGEEPCSFAVSKTGEEAQGTISSSFWAAARDGSAALFTTGGELYEYRAADHSTHPIAGEVLGLMGQSEDLGRVYLVSEEALTLPSEENENGEHAEAGAANLYLHERGEPGSFRFIGRLVGGDFTGLSPVALQPLAHTARVSADGGATAFMSAARLTGYDNADAASPGKADAEVFLYEADANEGTGELVCASCNPSGARPRGTLTHEGPLLVQAAAKIPVPQNMLYPGRELSADGRRLFFESFDPLSPRDTNGQKDVYQWEAPGEGGCSAASPTYSPRNRGCVDLISSGQSPRESSFLDASPDGADVFFATLAGLLPQDPGLVDVYDAREGGGLPAPPGEAPPCEAEACQHPAPAPPAATPASEAYEGPEDNPEAKKPRCPKGRHRARGKCVKRQKSGKGHRQRRAGR